MVSEKYDRHSDGFSDCKGIETSGSRNRLRADVVDAVDAVDAVAVVDGAAV